MSEPLYVVTVYPTMGTLVQRYNFNSIVEATQWAEKAKGNSQFRKLELSVILHTWRR